MRRGRDAAVEGLMGPQEKRLTSELAIYLVRSCSRALQNLPPGATLDLAGRRRWFEQAYREWQLTPRVDLAGRSPTEVIAAERAAARESGSAARPKPTIELYTDLPAFDLAPPVSTRAQEGVAGDADGAGAGERDGRDPNPGLVAGEEGGGWQRLADRLFGSWLDDKLDRL
jgi:hypothetical protein